MTVDRKQELTDLAKTDERQVTQLWMKLKGFEHRNPATIGGIGIEQIIDEIVHLESQHR